MSNEDHSFPYPIFVGGTARSGTHAVGRLIDAHPRYHMIKLETRFISATGGLVDLLNGETTMRWFLEKCYGKWWSRGLRHIRGLQLIVERERYEAAIARFQEEYEGDPWQASRRLIWELLDPTAERVGKPAWVEVSGPNIMTAPTLRKLFPEARFIHMVRDGRAVVAGIIRKRDMTDDLDRAMDHWQKRVLASAAALRQLPPDAALTIQLEDLAAHDRERTYAGLVDFLALDDDTAMRRYFDQEIKAERAHVGAWRQRIAPEDVRLIERRYRRLVPELRAEGVGWLADPEPRGRWPLRGRARLRAPAPEGRTRSD
jgi:Sulfotransferase family